MSKKRYINTTLWRDEYIASLDPSEKLLFIYLLTCPDTTIAGIYQIPIKIIAADTGFDSDMVIKILARFETDGKVLYRDGWVAIKNFIKHQNCCSPTVAAGIDRELKVAPEELKAFVGYGMHTVSDSDIYISQGIGKVFIAPTAKEVQSYLDDRSITTFTASMFIDFYTARGWLIGKTKMKDWQAAVRTWESRAKSDPKRHKTTEELYG